MRNLYRDMSEKGILYEDENGLVQFDKSFRFSDLNTAAQFLMHRGGDNTAAWTRENGEALTVKPAEAAPVQQPARKKPQQRRRQSQQKKQKAAVQKSPEQKKQEAPAPKKQEQKAPARQKNKPAPQQPRPKKEQPKEPDRKMEVRVIKAEKKETAEKQVQTKKKTDASGFLKNLFRPKG